MNSSWVRNRVLRFPLRTMNASHQHQLVRLKTRRATNLNVKAVLDTDGQKMDLSRLAQMKGAIEDNEEQTASVPTPDNVRAAVRLNKEPENNDMAADKEEEEDFRVPHYIKVHGWEKKSDSLHQLAKQLNCRRSDPDRHVVLEGTRLINDALDNGLQPTLCVFSRVGLLKNIHLDKIGKNCKYYHIPYGNVKMWSDLKTPTGVMAAFDRNQLMQRVTPISPLPITLICDNIRTPDNLGAVLRVAAAAGAQRALLTRGCVDPWSSKVLRAAAGAHFVLPLVEQLRWEEMDQHLPPFPHVVLADLEHQEHCYNEKAATEKLMALDEEIAMSGYSNSTELADPKLVEQYREIPVKTLPHGKFSLNPGCEHVVVVVGGETEGVSDAAYKLCHQYNGSRIYVPLRNNVNSLNVISATSIVMFQVQQGFLS